MLDKRRREARMSPSLAVTLRPPSILLGDAGQDDDEGRESDEVDQGSMLVCRSGEGYERPMEGEQGERRGEPGKEMVRRVSPETNEEQGRRRTAECDGTQEKIVQRRHVSVCPR